MSKVKSWFFLGLGWFFFGLGFVGIFLPVLPTTPFMILALLSFSKGSDTMHGWLLNHPKFGRSLRNWQEHSVIPMKAKMMALFFMSCSAIFLVFFSNIPTYAVTMAIISMVCAFIYISTRPSTPKQP